MTDFSGLSDRMAVLSDLFALDLFEELSEGTQDELRQVYYRLNAELQTVVEKRKSTRSF